MVTDARMAVSLVNSSTLGLTDPVDGTFQVTDANHNLIKTVAVTVLPADPVTATVK